MTYLAISNNNHITNIHCLKKLKHLSYLELRYCTQLIDVSALSKLNRLTSLNLAYCVNLRTIPDLSRCDYLLLLNLRGIQVADGIDSRLVRDAAELGRHEAVIALLNAIQEKESCAESSASSSK